MNKPLPLRLINAMKPSGSSTKYKLFESEATQAWKESAVVGKFKEDLDAQLKNKKSKP